MADPTIIEEEGGAARQTTAPNEAASHPSHPPAVARGSGNRLLWMVGGVFALLLAAWTAFIIIAGRHPVAPVPIAAPGGGR